MVFGTFLPEENPRKFLFLKPNSLVGGMIAQVSVKIILSPKFGHTRPTL
jgi:hypothetical protein